MYVVCVSVHALTPREPCRGQRMTWCGQFSPPATWALRTGLSIRLGGKHISLMNHLAHPWLLIFETEPRYTGHLTGTQHLPASASIYMGYMDKACTSRVFMYIEIFYVLAFHMFLFFFPVQLLCHASSLSSVLTWKLLCLWCTPGRTLMQP